MRVVEVIFGPGGGKVDKLRRDDPHRAAMLVQRASKLSKQPQTVKVAYQLLYESIRIDPRNVSARVLLATLLISTKNHSCIVDALEHLESALKVDPQNFEVLFNAGIAALELKNFGVAASFFELALDCFANRAEHAKVCINVALCYDMMGDTCASLKHWSRALELNPEIDNAEFVKFRLAQHSCDNINCVNSHSS